MIPITGHCVACKASPYDNADERLCTMCYASPFYKKRRTNKMTTTTKVLADGGGQRDDAGKPRVDLIPADAMLELGKVYGAGIERGYQERNWERGMKWSKCLGPLMRHLFKWMMGKKYDDGPEGTGQLHIAMVAWNAIALLTYELRGIGVDDRSAPIIEDELTPERKHG